jgi:hypothetical protein
MITDGHSSGYHIFGLILWNMATLLNAALRSEKKEASSGSVGRNESLIWQQGRDI